MDSGLEDWVSEVSKESENVLTTLCTELVEARKQRAELEAQVKKLSEAETALKVKILNYMKENTLSQVKGAFGTVSIVNKKSVQTPKTREEKEAFFSYLKDQGVYDDMISVNSRTLNSWVNREIEAREGEGVFGWVPPGLKPPHEFQDLRVAKK